MAAAQKQKLVYGILDFLQTSLKDGTVKEEDKEGLEVAMQCIGEAFDVDLTKSTHSIKPMTLLSIFQVFTQTQEKRAGSSSAAPSTSTAKTSKVVTAEDKIAAEALKAEGNRLISNDKDYHGAIAKYTAAIDFDPNQKVYYSNRAAAYSQAGDHGKAIDDAKKALDMDPTYAKAYSRLGHALFSSGRYAEAVDALEKGIEYDPENASMKSSLAAAKQRRDDGLDAEDEVPSAAAARGAPAAGMPDLASMLGGLGGGAGGMPDLSSIMSNPMVMQMAQQMMQNGGMERMMQNPMMRQMAENYQRGNGMPDMSQLGAMMQDPEMRNLAEQFGAATGAGRGRGRGANNNDMYS